MNQISPTSWAIAIAMAITLSAIAFAGAHALGTVMDIATHPRAWRTVAMLATPALAVATFTATILALYMALALIARAIDTLIAAVVHIATRRYPTN